eukprot:6051696-Pleurochrysis_carterae.AAC.1
MYHTNSCEYEAWQNPTEHHMRRLQEPMRMMYERGGAGEEYWKYSMTQYGRYPNGQRTKKQSGAGGRGKQFAQR